MWPFFFHYWQLCDQFFFSLLAIFFFSKKQGIFDRIFLSEITFSKKGENSLQKIIDWVRGPKSARGSKIWVHPTWWPQNWKTEVGVLVSVLGWIAPAGHVQPMRPASPVGPPGGLLSKGGNRFYHGSIVPLRNKSSPRLIYVLSCSSPKESNLEKVRKPKKNILTGSVRGGIKE